MQKLVITTQYLENYGDKENPYMKFKGGSTYVMPNCGDLNQNQIATIVAQVKPFICMDFEKSNGGCDEYIVDVAVVSLGKKVCDDWDTVTNFWLTDGQVGFMKVTDNRGDSGWYKKEILESTESWSNDRENYKVEYLMDDGDLVQGHLGLKEWFDNTQAA
jgi:hypothetical protein